MPSDPDDVRNVAELQSIDGGKWVLFWSVVMLVTHVLLLTGLALLVWVLLSAH